MTQCVVSALTQEGVETTTFPGTRSFVPGRIFLDVVTLDGALHGTVETRDDSIRVGDVVEPHDGSACWWKKVTS